jgi:hypothetical protein
LQPDGFSVVCIRRSVPLQLISATSEQCVTCSGPSSGSSRNSLYQSVGCAVYV